MLIATTNRQTDAIPFPRRKRAAREKQEETISSHSLVRDRAHVTIQPSPRRQNVSRATLDKHARFKVRRFILNGENVLVNNSFLVDETSVINEASKKSRYINHRADFVETK